jgi:3-isopropylmalate dehydrogenase
MKALIAVLAGDGIGPEVVAQGVRVISRIAELFGHDFTLEQALIGGCAIDTVESPLPEHTLALCKRADAILLGAVGGPKWSDPNASVRPEQGLLKLRAELGLFANLRPVKLFEAAAKLSPIKSEVLEGVDLLIVRELTGGIYFGEKRRTEDGASDLCAYTRAEVERVAHRAFAFARSRRGKLTQVDKANVLETSRLWRQTVSEVARQYPDVRLEHVLVDAMAMHLITRPRDFDVILTENLFGDILTDEASVLAGSMGMLPSASLGQGTRGLYEPIHGSAPDIAGQGIANPYATLLSVAMMLRHSFKLEAEAALIEYAVASCVDRGVLSRDLSTNQNYSTDAIGDAVLAELVRGYQPSQSAA